MLAYRSNPPMPAKKMHAADATDRAKIAQAVGFVTSFFQGRGQWDKHPTVSLEAARDVARQMMANADYVRTGRRPLIYALLPDSSEVLVPDDYVPGEAPRPEAESEHLPPPARADVTPAPDAGKGATNVELDRALATIMRPGFGDAKTGATGGHAMAEADALAVFPGLKKLSPRHWDAITAAQSGDLPNPPDASAKSWEGPVYRGRLEKLVAMARAGDVAGLEAEKLPTYDSGFVAMARYRNLALIALRARENRGAHD